MFVGGCAPESAPEPVVAPEESEESEPRYSEDILREEKEATAQVGVVIVEEAIQGYKLISPTKKYPVDLNALVEGGMMVSLPELPVGVQFVYDPETGEVDVIDVMNVDE